MGYGVLDDRYGSISGGKSAIGGISVARTASSEGPPPQPPTNSPMSVMDDDFDMSKDDKKQYLDIVLDLKSRIGKIHNLLEEYYSIIDDMIQKLLPYKEYSPDLFSQLEKIRDSINSQLTFNDSVWNCAYYVELTKNVVSEVRDIELDGYLEQDDIDAVLRLEQLVPEFEQTIENEDYLAKAGTIFVDICEKIVDKIIQDCKLQMGNFERGTDSEYDLYVRDFDMRRESLNHLSQSSYFSKSMNEKFLGIIKECEECKDKILSKWKEHLDKKTKLLSQAQEVLSLFNSIEEKCLEYLKKYEKYKQFLTEEYFDRPTLDAISNVYHAISSFSSFRNSDPNIMLYGVLNHSIGVDINTIEVAVKVFSDRCSLFKPDFSVLDNAFSKIDRIDKIGYAIPDSLGSEKSQRLSVKSEEFRIIICDEADRKVGYIEYNGKIYRTMVKDMDKLLEKLGLDTFESFKNNGQVIELFDGASELEDIRSRYVEQQLSGNFLDNFSNPLDDDLVAKELFAAQRNYDFSSKRRGIIREFILPEDSEMHLEKCVEKSSDIAYVLGLLLNNEHYLRTFTDFDKLSVGLRESLLSNKNDLKYLENLIRNSENLDGNDKEYFVILLNNFCNPYNEHICEVGKYDNRIYFDFNDGDIHLKFLLLYIEECIKNNISYDMKGFAGGIKDNVVFYSQHDNLHLRIQILEKILLSHPELRKGIIQPVYGAARFGTGFYGISHYGGKQKINNSSYRVTETYNHYFDRLMTWSYASLVAKAVVELDIAEDTSDLSILKSISDFNKWERLGDDTNVLRLKLKTTGKHIADYFDILKKYVNHPAVSRKIDEYGYEAFRQNMYKIHAICQGFSLNEKVDVAINREMFEFFGKSLTSSKSKGKIVDGLSDETKNVWLKTGMNSNLKRTLLRRVEDVINERKKPMYGLDPKFDSKNEARRLRLLRYILEVIGSIDEQNFTAENEKVFYDIVSRLERIPSSIENTSSFMRLDSKVMTFILGLEKQNSLNKGNISDYEIQFFTLCDEIIKNYQRMSLFGIKYRDKYDYFARVFETILLKFTKRAYGIFSEQEFEEYRKYLLKLNEYILNPEPSISEDLEAEIRSLR